MASGTSASIRGKNREPTELRIVLIGGRRNDKPSGKSSVGNIILGRDVFETNSRTVKSVMRQEVVSGRQVTVVDTPGWTSSSPLDLTPKLTQLEIQQSVNLCPPGPHAFVLVMPLDIPYEGTDMSAEEHLSLLLSDRVWKHTIVVFTVADKNKMRSDLSRYNYIFRYLIEKCEGRFHVLNITDRGDRSQVTELMEKIDQMVTSNGCHYETEKHVSEELKEMERTISRRAEQRRADAQKQTTGLPKDTGLTDLRIVLLGRCWSGKSSAGNTILGGSGFKVRQRGQRSVQCEVRHGEVAGRHVTVVDSPGWYHNSPLQDTSEMDKLEIQNSVSLCPPGPHAVLVMVPLDRAFTKAQRVALEEHMTLLSQRVWSHAIVLFTKGDCLGDRSIEQHIEAEGEDLRWLVDKCGNRYHVFNNQKTDDTQVTELLWKIEEMVTGNRGGHYEDDGDVSETLSERKKITEEHVQTFLTKTQRQRTALKALFEGEHQSLPDVKVMLVGGEHDQRSRAGNLIMQKAVFKYTPYKEFKTQTKLTECVRKQRRVAGRNVSVVNCPDWSTTPPSQKIKDVLLHGVTLCSPEPHAVLLTVDVRSSFSEADRRSVEEHMGLLGDRVWRHTLVLFTWGFWLGERRVEEYIESEGEPLRWILEKCGYRYHVLNPMKYDISELEKLMEKIEHMVMRNRGHFGQMPLFERLKGITEEQWKKREQEMIERMLKSVVTETEEPTLPAVRRRNNMDLEDAWSMDFPPDMSGGTRSSGYDTMSEAPTQTDADSVVTSLLAVRRRNSKQWNPPSMSGGTRSSEFDTMSVVSSLADTDEIQQKTLFERLTGRSTLTPQEWKKREEEVIERMLKFVMMEPQEPSTSGIYCWSPAKVSDWLTTHVGPIAPSSGYDTMSIAPSQADTDVMSMEYQGAVLIYEDLQSSDGHTFRIYLTDSYSSDYEDIKRELESEKGRFSRVQTTANCTLVHGKYHLTSEPRGEIDPKVLPFTLEQTKFKGYFKVHYDYELSPPFKFNLKVSGTDDPAWTATIQEGDLGIKEKNTSKRENKYASGVEEPQITQKTDAWVHWVEMMKIENGEEELKTPDLDDSDNDEVYSRSCCEKCKHVQQSYANEMIIPEKLSRGRLQVQLKAEGTYECVFTGLIFEAAERVQVRYCVLSWSKFGKFLQNPWMIAGPIFNIRTVDKDASALKFIQFPHSLCLAGQGNEMVFGVLHITGKHPIIERVQYSGSHIKWPVSSLSPAGSAVILDTQQEHHGAVLVYQNLRSSEDSLTFRIYLALSCSSWRKEIKKELKKGRYSRVDKNTLCPLVQRKYHLTSEESDNIHPEDLIFTLVPTMYKGFFEACFKQPPPFTLYLNASGNEVTAWSANIQQGDLVDSPEKRPSKPLFSLLGRFRSGSIKTTMLGKQRHDATGEGSSSLHELDASGVEQPQITQTTGMKANFVKHNMRALIQRVTAVIPIADDLRDKVILSSEMYNTIRETKPRQEQMRMLLDVTCTKGNRAMSEFYNALQEHERWLVEDLEHPS